MKKHSKKQKAKLCEDEKLGFFSLSKFSHMTKSTNSNQEK